LIYVIYTKTKMLAIGALDPLQVAANTSTVNNTCIPRKQKNRICTLPIWDTKFCVVHIFYITFKHLYLFYPISV